MTMHRHVMSSGGPAAALLAALVLWPGLVVAQAPKANGELLRIQNYAGTTGNMHAIVAKAKGFCDSCNFKCETVTTHNPA